MARVGRSFAIRYHPVWLVFFSLIGLGPYASGVDLEDEELRIRLGWAFRMAALGAPPLEPEETELRPRRRRR